MCAYFLLLSVYFQCDIFVKICLTHNCHNLTNYADLFVILYDVPYNIINALWKLLLNSFAAKLAQSLYSSHGNFDLGKVIYSVC